MENSMKKWHQKWWGRILIILGILTLSLGVAIALYFVNLVQKMKSGDYLSQLPTKSSYYTSDKQKQLIEGVNDYWTGAANPKLTIVEFADFECPYCENAYPIIREISLKYKDSVKIIYRDYPNHQDSTIEAMAARCAGEQGLFWPMHDKLFQNQGLSSTSDLTQLAYEIGADTTRFSTCLNSSKYLTQIQKDYTDAESLNLTGTPAWFFNGYKIEGDIPENTFMKIVDGFVK